MCRCDHLGKSNRRSQRKNNKKNFAQTCRAVALAKDEAAEERGGIWNEFKLPLRYLATSA
jgi:hypothetical protein